MYGDAIGNEALYMNTLLKGAGYNSKIYAEYIPTESLRKTNFFFKKSIKCNKEDIILYHLSTYSVINDWILTQKCRKIMIYHNITPPSFFENYSRKDKDLCLNGYIQTEKLKNEFDLVLADSNYNNEQLNKLGFSCPIKILPVLLSFDDYKKVPEKEIVEKYSDDYINIIFVGRIVPNKCQEDIISAFSYYQKYYNPKSRLFLVGKYTGMEKYYLRLRDYADKLKINNIDFLGHVTFKELLAYYYVSNLFLCMSEHEGFCVPLVEAMFFKKPILAYNSTAVAETIWPGGVLMDKKNPLEAAALINMILTDERLKNIIINNQKEKLFDYCPEKTANLFLSYISEFIR